jgi:mRNA interferase MazF
MHEYGDDALVDEGALSATELGYHRVGMVVARFEVYLVLLDSTEGHEIQKTCPCVVISPDELIRYIRTVTVAPMTTECRPYPTHIPARFQRKSGQTALDQLRTVDKPRLVRRLGKINPTAARGVLAVLGEMFVP